MREHKTLKLKQDLELSLLAVGEELRSEDFTTHDEFQYY